MNRNVVVKDTELKIKIQKNGLEIPNTLEEAIVIAEAFEMDAEEMEVLKGIMKR